jgi:hypothetical protein
MAELTCRMYGLVAKITDPNRIAINLALALQDYNNKIVDIEEEIARGLKLSHQEYYTHGAFKQWTKDKDLVLIDERKNKISAVEKSKNSDIIVLLKKLKEHNIETGVHIANQSCNELTCLVFVADERAYNEIDYPSFEHYLSNHQTIIDTFEYYRSFESIVDEIKSNRSQVYLDWVNSIGGERNEFLREFIKQLKEF